jgi:hypothetical protein
LFNGSSCALAQVSRKNTTSTQESTRLERNRRAGGRGVH